MEKRVEEEVIEFWDQNGRHHETREQQWYIWANGCVAIIKFWYSHNGIELIIGVVSDGTRPI